MTANRTESESSRVSGDAIVDSLQQISSLINLKDVEQVELFSKIQQSPNASDAPLKLIKLLTLLIKTRMDIPSQKIAQSCTARQLISYLGSYVALLQAITHNSELASLFLIGNNGEKSFTELEKSTLLEQAARTQQYLSSLNISPTKTTLLDYEKNLEDLNSLPEKMKELSSYKAKIEQSQNIEEIKSLANIILLILETSMIFNDVLIQNSNKNIDDFEDPCHKKKSKKYKKACKKMQIQFQILQDELSEKEAQISSLQRELKDAKHANDHLIDKMNKSTKNENYISSQVESLLAQKNQLAEDLNCIKDRLDIDNQTAIILNRLKEKLKKVENENRRMRQLLDEANLNQNKILSQYDSTSSELKSELASKRHENELLKNQISHLHEQIDNYQNQMAKKDQKTDCLSDRINDLETQIHEQSKTQTRLQNRIIDLEHLYKDATSQLDQNSQTNSDLSRQIQKLRKEVKLKSNENDELKVMLDHATNDSKKQIADNATLIKQLRRYETSGNNQSANEEIQKLKEKLKSSYRFIKKLQLQITEYKRKMKQDEFDRSGDYNYSSENFCDDYQLKVDTRHYEYYDMPNYHPVKTDYNALDAKLNDLSITIKQLEKTVHQSRKQTGLSSSSDTK